MHTEYNVPYHQAVEVFEFAYANITTDPYRIAADFEKIVKRHFKEIDQEMLVRMMAMPMEYWKRLVSLIANKKPILRMDTIQTSEKKEPKPLHLVLQRIYFDQILAGTKTSEYREEKRFYNSRLMRDGKYRNYSHVDFQEGYRKDARRMKVTINKVELRNGIYEIYLGEIIETNFK